MGCVRLVGRIREKSAIKLSEELCVAGVGFTVVEVSTEHKSG